MSYSTCRICKSRLPASELLRLNNMPQSAQGFLTPDDVKTDKGVDLSIFECAACGLVQANCAPVSYYREVIRTNAFSTAMQAFRAKFLHDFVSRFELKGKSILEIGCGNGEYLDLFHNEGLICSGTEFGEAAVEACKAKGHRVQKCFPDQPTVLLENTPFDCFATFNFLEHWPEPSLVLKSIHANTTVDAIGLVEVPNFEMILKENLFSEFIADHLSYFTRDTLELLLRINGFDVIESRSIWHDYILSVVVRKRPSVDVAEFAVMRCQLDCAVQAFLAKHSESGVAIWGAGHQALAVISLLNISDKIRYVVDSAPFKQGRLTPASHLPIHPPAYLRVDPVGAVLIIAAGYSDEVLRILRTEFDSELNVAILRENHLEEAG